MPLPSTTSAPIQVISIPRAQVAALPGRADGYIRTGRHNDPSGLAGDARRDPPISKEPKRRLRPARLASSCGHSEKRC